MRMTCDEELSDFRIFSIAFTSQKSPSRTDARPPSSDITVGIPLRCLLSSATSSCSRVALCRSSEAAAYLTVSSVTKPPEQALAASNVRTGLSCLPECERIDLLVLSSKSMSEAIEASITEMTLSRSFLKISLMALKSILEHLHQFIHSSRE